MKKKRLVIVGSGGFISTAVEERNLKVKLKYCVYQENKLTYQSTHQ